MKKRHKSKKYVQKYKIWKGKEKYVKNLEVSTIDHFFFYAGYTFSHQNF